MEINEGKELKVTITNIREVRSFYNKNFEPIPMIEGKADKASLVTSASLDLIKFCSESGYSAIDKEVHFEVLKGMGEDNFLKYSVSTLEL